MWQICVIAGLLMFTTYLVNARQKTTDSFHQQTTYFFHIVLLVIWFETLYFTISFGQLKMTPHSSVDRNMVHIIDNLLDCAVQHAPTLEDSWNKLKKCTRDSHIYSVSKSKVPIMSTVPVAFVTPRLFPQDIFLVNSEYKNLSEMHKALVIIHECTHLTLDTIDHAYIWENKFTYLSEAEHLHNADSYVGILLNTCVNDIYVF